MPNSIEYEDGTVQGELRRLFDLAWPSYIVNVSFAGFSIVDSIVLGHYGTQYLASAAYADIVMDFTTLLFLQGFNQGLRTLASQAYGAKTYSLIGKYTQIAIVCVTLATLPLAVLWWYVGDILALFHRQLETIAYVNVYARLNILSMWPRMMFGVLNTYFLSQHIVVPTGLIALGSLLVHGVLTSTFVLGIGSWNGLGFIGCPLARFLSFNLRFFGALGYMCWYRQLHLRTWSWSWSFLRWNRFCVLVQVGVPLMLGNAFENAQFQITALFASMLGQTSLAAHSCILELILVLSCPIYGLNNGVVTRIAYYLGQDKPFTAREVSYLGLKIILGIAILVVLFLIAGRNVIGHVYSTDVDVQAQIHLILLVAATGYFLLSFFYYSMASLIAQARPLPIMLAFGIGAWGVGVPSAYYLGIVCEYGIVGLWVGLSAGYAMTTLIGVVGACSSDWKKAATDAVLRAQQSPTLPSRETEETQLLRNTDDSTSD